MKNSKTILSLFLIEVLSKLKASLLWVFIWSLLSILFASVFNDLSKTADTSIKLYQSLPPEILKTVNISDGYLTSVEKFLSGQFLTIYLLAGGIFTFFIGINLIGGKIENGTIFNILNKPIPRVNIYLIKTFTNILIIFIMNSCVGIIMYSLFIIISNQKEISVNFFISLYLGTSILFSLFLVMGELIGLLVNKVHAQIIGGGFIFISFLLNGLGSMDGIPDWINKISIFYYLNSVKIRDYFMLDWERLFIILLISIVMIVVGVVIFRKKDIYII